MSRKPSDANMLPAQIENVLHVGPLTLSSLDNAFKRYLFIPSRADAEDIFYLGWKHGRFSKEYKFKLSSLSFATAEGVSALAAIIECLRREPAAVSLTISPDSEPWATALNLSQLVNNEWSSPEVLAPREIDGSDRKSDVYGK